MELLQILAGFDGLYHTAYSIHRHLLEVERKGPHLSSTSVITLIAFLLFKSLALLTFNNGATII